MKKDTREQQKQNLKTLSQVLFQELKAEEHLSLSYSGEESVFLRINTAKIRQASEIRQEFLTVDFISQRQHTECTFTLTGDLTQDLKRSLNILEQCRMECEALPEDPYIVLPEEGGKQ